MTVSTDREIGRLSAEMDSLKDQLTAVKKQLEDQGDMIREMRDLLVATKGSWRFLVGTVGFAAAVAGLAGSVLTWWNMGGR